MSDFLYGSICVSDIPRELFKKAANGKVYLNIAVSRKREVDQFGNTHTAIASVPKGQRGENDKPIYCGNLKEYNPSPSVNPEDIDKAPSASYDDLPF